MRQKTCTFHTPDWPYEELNGQSAVHFSQAARGHVADARKSGTGVPTFSLYGEHETATDAEFVHIEDIRSRSALYDWRIDTHAHRGLYQIVLVLEGEASVRIDDAESRAAAPAVITVAPAVVHGFRFQPQTRGFVLTIAEAMLFGSGGQRLGPSFDELLRHSGIIELSEDPHTAGILASTLEHLAAEFRWPQPGRAMMLDWLVRTCLLLIMRHRAAVTHAARSAGTREDLFARFRMLVEEHYRDHWSVARYARA